MPRVKLLFGLRDREGRIEFSVESGKLCEVLERIGERVPGVVEGCAPAPGHLILVDDVDVRLLDKDYVVQEDSTIVVIPVNHPG